LAKAKDRLHIVEGLIIGALNASEIVEIFKKNRDEDAAKEIIRKKFKLSEIQADHIAQMQLRRITGLSREQYEAEKTELIARIAYLQGLLDDPEKLKGVLKDEMRALIKEFGQERRTRIDGAASAKDEVEDVAAVEEAKPVLISLTRNGLIKVLPADAYKAQKKGGAGLQSGAGKDDGVYRLLPAQSTDFALVVSSLGRVCMVPTKQFPEGTRTSKGEPAHRFVALGANEQVEAIVPFTEFAEDTFLVTVTKNGQIKRSALSEYKNAGAKPIDNMRLLGDDTIVEAFLSDGAGDYLLVSTGGKGLRIKAADVRPAGRVGQGVAGIALPKGVAVAAAMPIGSDDKRALFVVGSDGFGKRTPLNQFNVKGRGTSGMEAIALGKGATVAAAFPVDETQDVLMGSAGGQVVRTAAAEISRQGRPSRGVRLMTLAAGDKVATAAPLGDEAPKGEGPTDAKAGKQAKAPAAAAEKSAAAPAKAPAAAKAATAKTPARVPAVAARTKA
jgi:DNA gyrase subunit A